MAHAEVKTWDSETGEDAMQDMHYPAWITMIEKISEKSLADKQVLDFGCNRGGFLNVLYKNKPFKNGMGVDIAMESLSAARENNKGLPITFDHSNALANLSEQFDIVFSHEVVYLLPDLKDHAEEIHKSLKKGGAYYLAIGEYTENPLWPRWKKVIEDFSPVRPYTYSLQEMAETFEAQGFDVYIRRLVCDHFLKYEATDEQFQSYIKSPIEYIQFKYDYMFMFKLIKK